MSSFTGSVQERREFYLLIFVDLDKKICTSKIIYILESISCIGCLQHEAIQCQQQGEKAEVHC